MVKLQDRERRELINELIDLLQHHADPKTKQWFDNYLKGAITYRGVKTPQVTTLVKNWYSANQLKNYSLQEQLSLCHSLIASNLAEDKFAGIIYMQKFLLAKIEYRELLREADLWFQQGYFFDWSTTDWFCTIVLDPTIVSNDLPAAKIIADWRYSENFWQRRAAIVAFRHASHQSKYHSLIEQIIDYLVTEERRFIQTGIGWVLADMSKKYPQQAEVLFRKHLSRLQREVIDRHTKHLDCHQELKQLKRQRSK